MLQKIINKTLSAIDERFQAENFYLHDFSKISADIKGSDKWSEFQRKILKELNKSPANFLRQKTISFTLHPNQQYLGSKYFFDLINSKEMDDVYFNLLTENNFGNPFNLRVYPRTSPTLVQHIHHLMMIERFFSRKLWSFNKVVEFGGGYGSLARLLSRINYDGEHTICDLEFMTRLQAFYLENLQLPNYSVNWTQNLENLSSENSADTILIATWSYSETDLMLREKLLPIIMSYENIFLTFQKEFSQIDNLNYFRSLMEKHKNILIFESDIYPQNYYFIKRKKLG